MNLCNNNNSNTSFEWNGTTQQYPLPVQEIDSKFQQNFINITNKSYFPQPRVFKSPTSTYVVTGKILSDSDITIIARNLIVSGEIKTTATLTLKLEDMLMVVENGTIRGGKEIITCSQKVTNNSVEYYNTNNN